MYAVTGNTFAHKSILSQIGKWDATRKAWVVDEKGKTRVEQACFRALRSGELQIVAASYPVAADRKVVSRGKSSVGMYDSEKRDLGLSWDFDL